MIKALSNHKTDEQLDAIMCDTSHWAINGPGGGVLSFAPSLRRALDRAGEFSSSGAVVTGLSRLPFDNIVVRPDQMLRLRKLIAGREVSPIKLTAARADADG